MDAPSPITNYGEPVEGGPPIIQYWHSESIPSYIDDLFATFRERNSDMLHLVFNERTAAAFIAAHFGPRELGAFRTCAVPAMQADYLRYCAVLALGGVYSDADIRCVGRLRPLIPGPGSGHLVGLPTGPVVNGFFAFGSAGHDFLELTLEIATANIERRLCNRVYYTTGPPIFSTLHQLHRLGSFDAVLELSEGRLDEEFVRAYCEAIGDYTRVSRAMEGIEILSKRDREAIIQSPGVPLPYKGSATHWTNLEQEIFR
jgi:mannosyltransferase OCH1-like enzyme